MPHVIQTRLVLECFVRVVIVIVCPVVPLLTNVELVLFALGLSRSVRVQFLVNLYCSVRRIEVTATPVEVPFRRAIDGSAANNPASTVRLREHLGVRRQEHGRCVVGMYRRCVGHVEEYMPKDNLVNLQVMRVVAVLRLSCRRNLACVIVPVFVGPYVELTDLDVSSTGYVEHDGLAVFFVNLQVAARGDFVYYISAVDVDGGVVGIIPCIDNHFSVRDLRGLHG